MALDEPSHEEGRLVQDSERSATASADWERTAEEGLTHSARRRGLRRWTIRFIKIGSATLPLKQFTGHTGWPMRYAFRRNQQRRVGEHNARLSRRERRHLPAAVNSGRAWPTPSVLPG